MRPRGWRWLTAYVPSVLLDPALAVCFLLSALLVWLAGSPLDLRLVSVLHLMLSAIVVSALANRRRAAHHDSEKGFWRDLLWAIFIWLVADGALAFSESVGWPGFAVLTRCFGVGAWLAVWLAAAQNPHRRGHWRPRQVERRLHSAGAAVIFLGSLAYVAGPPALVRDLDRASQATWLLLAVFAFLILGRLTALVWQAENSRWRWVYGALASAAAVMTMAHFRSVGSPEPEASAVFGGPWAAVALTLLVLCARLDQVYNDDETGPWIGDPIEEGPRHLEAPYLAFAVALPLVHHAASRSGFFDPALESMREWWTLIWAVILALVSIYQQKRLEKWTRKTLNERSRLERSLQASRRRLQLMEERQEIEKVLHRSQEIYTKAFRGSPWAVVLTSLEDGRHLEFNERYLESIGFSREEAIGKTTVELGIWAKAEERDEMVRRLAEDGQVRALKITFRRSDGEERPALFAAVPAEIDGEKCLLSISRDLGDLYALELRRSAVTRVLDGLPAAIWHVDLMDRILSVNRPAEGLAGPFAEQKGRPLIDSGLLLGIDSWREAMRQTIERGGFEGQLSVRLGEQERRVSVLTTLVRDHFGLPSGKLLFMHPEG